MIGIFEKKGESVIDLENFGNVNGAAIIQAGAYYPAYPDDA